MKRLSEINEGAIGDIIKRASSNDERIEDEENINDMYPDEFFEYLNKNYKIENNSFDIFLNGKEKVIDFYLKMFNEEHHVMIFFHSSDERDYEIDRIGISKCKKGNEFDFLKNYGFDIAYDRDYLSYIGVETNDEAITVLNDIISNCKTNCNLERIS